MPAHSRPQVRTSVLLTVDQHARLNEIAARADVSVAWVIRHAVQHFLEQGKNEQIPLPIRMVHESRHE